MRATPAERGVRAFLPPGLVRRGAALLHQQCWCWGSDVRRPDGNLLLAYGFERTRLPGAIGAGSSRYATTRGDGTTIVLWGFGVFVAVAGRGAAFLERYRFVPLVTPGTAPPDVWSLDGMKRALSRAHVPDRLEPIEPWRMVFIRALDEIFEYELWVQRTFGPDYRQTCLRGWRGKPAVSGDRQPTAWLDLAHDCDSSLRQSCDARPWEASLDLDHRARTLGTTQVVYDIGASPSATSVR